MALNDEETAAKHLLEGKLAGAGAIRYDTNAANRTVPAFACLYADLQEGGNTPAFCKTGRNIPAGVNSRAQPAISVQHSRLDCICIASSPQMPLMLVLITRRDKAVSSRRAAQQTSVFCLLTVGAPLRLLPRPQCVLLCNARRTCAVWQLAPSSTAACSLVQGTRSSLHVLCALALD